MNTDNPKHVLARTIMDAVVAGSRLGHGSNWITEALPLTEQERTHVEQTARGCWNCGGSGVRCCEYAQGVA